MNLELDVGCKRLEQNLETTVQCPASPSSSPVLLQGRGVVTRMVPGKSCRMANQVGRGPFSSQLSIESQSVRPANKFTKSKMEKKKVQKVHSKHEAPSQFFVLI